MRGEERVHDLAVGSADHGAHVEERCEHAAGCARSHRERGRQEFCRGEPEQFGEGKFCVQRQRNRIEPAPLHLRSPQRHESCKNHPDHHFDHGGEPQALQELAEVVKEVDEQDCHRRFQHAQDEVERQFQRRGHGVAWDGEEVAVGEHGSAHRPGQDGRDHHHAEIGAAQVLQQHFQGEEDPGDGRVEAGGDSRGSTTGHQGAHPLVGHLHPAAQDGAQRSAEMGRRAFTPGRPAKAQGGRCGDGPPDDHPQRHPALLQRQGAQRVGDAAAGRLRSQVAHDEPDDHAAQRRDRHYVQHRVADVRLEKRGYVVNPCHEDVESDDGRARAESHHRGRHEQQKLIRSPVPLDDSNGQRDQSLNMLFHRTRSTCPPSPS